MLEVSHLHASYGDVEVLHDVSLRVDEGEVVVIVGANAAGKTTTLRSLSGLLRRAQGDITFEGRNLQGVPSYKRVELGMVQIPEGRRLFPHMSVWENLELGAFSPRARAQRGRTLKEVLELFPILAERRSQMAGSLSGGEQQMCAIGRGLMALPRLLMLDEPSLGLAPLAVQRVFESVRQIQSRGTTILLVEQNVRHSLSIADRAYVLENGRVVLEGPGQDLLGNEALKKAYMGM